MAKGDVKFCRIEAFIDRDIYGSVYLKPVSLSPVRGRVLDLFINISEKSKLLEDLKDDPDTTYIRISDFVDPWYLKTTTYRRTLGSINGYKNCVEIGDTISCRPYGTPEEVKKIETIWISAKACSDVLRGYSV